MNQHPAVMFELIANDQERLKKFYIKYSAGPKSNHTGLAQFRVV